MKIIQRKIGLPDISLRLVLTILCIASNCAWGDPVKGAESEGSRPTDAGLDRQDPARREVTQILERAIAAKGGRDALDRFKVNKTIAASRGTEKGKSFSIRVTTYVQLPSKLRLDQEVLSDSGKSLSHVTIYILGDDTLTMAKPAFGFIPKKISPDSEQKLRQALYIGECVTLIPLLDSAYQIEKVVSTKGVTEDHAIALRVRKSGKRDVTLFFDQDSGNLIGIDYDQPAKGGRLVHTSERYSDFRSFSGLTCPATIKYTEGSDIEGTEKIESTEPLDSFPEPSLNAQQVAELGQTSLQTLKKLQRNDAALQQQQTAPSQQTTPTEALTPLTVDDIKAITTAGLKKESIIEELQKSESKFTPEDVAAAQQANPPIDPAVIEYMKKNAR